MLEEDNISQEAEVNSPKEYRRINNTETDGNQRAGADDDSPRSVVRELMSWIFTVVVAIGLALVLNRFVLINAEIPSGSMENTIMTDDKIIGFRLSYLFSDPKRGDIIIFRNPDNESENYVKRVIGLPGETVMIDNGCIYVDGELLEEDYLKEDWTLATGPYLFEVPEESYLVLGDNRNNSYDARYWNHTYVERDKILGKALFCYWPLHDIGGLH